jgi:hypothetical protein
MRTVVLEARKLNTLNSLPKLAATEGAPRCSEFGISVFGIEQSPRSARDAFARPMHAPQKA